MGSLVVVVSQVCVRHQLVFLACCRKHKLEWPAGACAQSKASSMRSTQSSGLSILFISFALHCSVVRSLLSEVHF